MAQPAPLLSTVHDAYGILFNRPILLVLSLAAIGVYASTLSIYETRVASTGALAPPRGSALVVNWVALIPSIISSVFSITHLSLLTRVLIRAHRRKSRGLASADEVIQPWERRRQVIHPGWLLMADGVCWAFFLTVAVLTGV